MRWAIVWGVVAALAPSPVYGSPLELFGYGGRSPGKAGTGVATAADFSAVYLNPAGLAHVRRKRLTLGAAAVDFDLEIDGAGTGTDSSTGTVFGGEVPVPLGGALEDRVGFGIGLYIPNEALVQTRVPFPGEPVYALLETRSQTIGIMTAVGVKISERWSAGAGILALAALRGNIFVDSDAAGRFTATSEQRLVTDLAPILGVRFRAARDLDLGLTFRGASESDYSVLVENDLQDDLPLTLPTLQIAGTAQYDPLMLAAEAAYRPVSTVELAGQLTYQRWSDFPLPTKNPIPGAPPLDSPAFHDTVVPRVSAEVGGAAGPVHLTGRGGYAFAWSPAPEMDGQQSLLDNHRHILAAGGGISLPGATVPIYVDLWVQLHRLVERTHTKDPSQFESEEEMPFDSVDTGGAIFVGGMTMGVDL